MGLSAVFTPIVTVNEDGSIEIDWTDSYQYLIDDENGMELVNFEVAQARAKLLDDVLVITSGDPAFMLNNLADYIDKRRPKWPSTGGTIRR